MGLQTNTQLSHDGIFQLFIHHTTVLTIESYDELSIYNENDCEVIIFVPDSSITDRLKDIIIYKGIEFELRHFAIINSSGNSWKGKMFSRHGGSSYKMWWESDRRNEINIHVSEDHMNQLNWRNTRYAVYVTTKEI